jgi:hypothetical protein
MTLCGVQRGRWRWRSRREQSKRRRSKAARLSERANASRGPNRRGAGSAVWLAGEQRQWPRDLRQDRRELQNVSLGMHGLLVSRFMPLASPTATARRTARYGLWLWNCSSTNCCVDTPYSIATTTPRCAWRPAFHSIAPLAAVALRWFGPPWESKMCCSG